MCVCVCVCVCVCQRQEEGMKSSLSPSMSPPKHNHDKPMECLSHYIFNPVATIMTAAVIIISQYEETENEV